MLPRLLRLDYSSNRVFGLDIIRAIAIIAVLLVHGMGYIPEKLHALRYVVGNSIDGVTMFFVLSGYLIGGILIRTLETQPAHGKVLLNFWLKRWMRTVPPYLLALVLVICCEMSRDSAIHLRDYLPFVVFLQNFNWPHPRLFAEAWSLAVEEWFYLISASSIFLLVGVRLRPRHAILLVAAAFIILTPLYRYISLQYMQPTDWTQWELYFRKIVLMRLDSLMFGVLGAYVAYYYPGIWQRIRIPSFILGVGIQLLLFALGPYTTPASIYAAVWLLTGHSLVTAFILPLLSQVRHGRGLLFKIITHISLISYSMYLLHRSIINNSLVWPMATSLPLPGILRTLIGYGSYWGLSLVAATIMYKYFEVPVMALRRYLK